MRTVSSQEVVKTTTTTQTQKLVQMIQPQLQKADQTILFRVVGAYEYANALDKLTELVKISTKEEVKVYDEIIKRRKQFDIYSNLSRNLIPKNSSFHVSSTGTTDNFRRSGLDWVMALARVELGAILAGYTHFEKPFEMLKPTNFERHAYGELLLDGAITHYWAMKKDREFGSNVGGGFSKPTSQTIAYIRRLAMGREMFNAAIRARKKDWTQQQLVEGNQYLTDLQKVRTSLVRSVQNYLKPKRNVVDLGNVSSSKPQEEILSSQEHTYVNACSALLRMESQEIQRGTARVETFDFEK